MFGVLSGCCLKKIKFHNRWETEIRREKKRRDQNILFAKEESQNRMGSVERLSSNQSEHLAEAVTP